jgi:hypothetical protein
VVNRLSDAPRRGVQPRLTTEQVCQIVALACERPSGTSRRGMHRCRRLDAARVRPPARAAQPAGLRRPSCYW